MKQGFPAGKIRVIENGLDVERFAASTVRLPEPPARPHFGFLGSLAWQKGVVGADQIAWLARLPNSITVADLTLTFEPLPLATTARLEVAVNAAPLCDGSPCQARNVLGVLPGRDPAYAGEVAIISGHYDHLGHGGDGSLAPDAHDIHNGADDNASAVAGATHSASTSSSSSCTTSSCGGAAATKKRASKRRGGPTGVINASLVGVIEEVRKGTWTYRGSKSGWPGLPAAVLECRVQ